MEPAQSRLLLALPSFLSLTSMVTDDPEDMITGLRHAERKSPACYDPARALFFRVLQGDFTFDIALAQARKLTDDVERKCAIGVLEASKSFLLAQPTAKVGRLPQMSISLPNGMEVNVSPVWIRHLAVEQLMILHVWRTPLSDYQLSIIGGILQAALIRHQPRCARRDLELISVAAPEHASGRRLRSFSWEKLRPLDDDGLRRALSVICYAWAEYQRRGPREVMRKAQPDLFNRAR